MKITGNPGLLPQFRSIAEAKPSVQRNATRVVSDMATISPLGKSLSEGKDHSVDSQSITQIMAGKSLRNIRYTELVSIADKLRDAGQLADKDYLDFIGPSPEFSSIDGSRNPNWDAPMDYIGRHEMNLAFMIATGSEQRFIDFERHLLSLYKSFEP
ncbi:hypothetical protein [Methylomonas rapida]|uniref:Uncharacterized protein n=1 Tax=Methylomonas rapida TaxID=2963939 RepID=A0ABY7GP21_9GAMM|nr:hypothetical protein [Methylomonas rapida]WAR46254.1 hypothetical protein NM686_006970 [Methylomonas rapida]